MSNYLTPARRQAKRECALKLLGYVAKGYKIPAAATTIGIGRRSGEKVLADLRKEMNAFCVTHLVYLATKEGLI